MPAALTHYLARQVYQKFLVSHILSRRVSDTGMRATAMVSLFQQRGWTKHIPDFSTFHGVSGNRTDWELE